MWLAAEDKVFAAAEQALLAATQLAHPVEGATPSPVVDASATHMGACLQQQLRGKQAWQPLGFFCKILKMAQQKYSAFYRELFACYTSIRHLRPMLDGHRFTISIDHKPLTSILARVSDQWTARQCKLLSMWPNLPRTSGT